MQYKRWVARYGIVIPEEQSLGIFDETEDDEMDYEADRVLLMTRMKRKTMVV